MRATDKPGQEPTAPEPAASPATEEPLFQGVACVCGAANSGVANPWHHPKCPAYVEPAEAKIIPLPPRSKPHQAPSADEILDQLAIIYVRQTKAAYDSTDPVAVRANLRAAREAYELYCMVSADDDA